MNKHKKYLNENTQGKSAKVYASLIKKKKDLIFVSEPSDDILKQAKEANVEFDMTGIGRDGFVFIVNKDNPVNSLTIEQIQKIYTGEITNWNQVGGNDEEIVAFQREQKFRKSKPNGKNGNERHKNERITIWTNDC